MLLVVLLAQIETNKNMCIYICTYMYMYIYISMCIHMYVWVCVLAWSGGNAGATYYVVEAHASTSLTQHLSLPGCCAHVAEMKLASFGSTDLGTLGGTFIRRLAGL